MSASSGAGDSDDVQSRLSGTSSALQTLLRRLGNGMEDLLPNASGRARMKELLSYLKDHGNDVKQMEALTEICEVLSMGQEDILIGFNVDSFLPVLVELLNAEHNPEIMLLSCRAITHMLEVLPKSAAKVVTSGAVPIFCQRLLNIEFIDVAEQSLLAIHKLSIEHPEPIMKANGLSAVLTFIDFFDINTQRTAVMTAANICRNMSGDSFVYVSDMLQNLTFLLSNSDQKIVESSCICFSRLVDSFAKSSVQLEQISSYGALLRLLSLLRPGDRESRGLTTGTYTLVVKTLAICCRGSSSIAISLLKENIVQTVFHIIRKEDEKLGGNALITAVAVHRPMEQLLHTLMLANEVLPPLRTDDRVTQFVRDISHGTDMTQDLYGVEGSLSQLNNFVELNPGVLVEYSELLYPILVDISVTIVNDAMRITCLSAVAKLLASLQRDELYKVVNGSQLLGYISGFIATGRPAIAGLALIVAEMLLEKLPEKLAPHFAREGVVHEVNRLCSKELAVPDTAMDALLDHARHFQATQLHTGSAAAACASSDMQLAKASQVAKRLDAGEIEVLKDLRDLFSCARETPSCYQILTSGLASSLLLWLQQRVPGRLVAFVKTFCMKNSEDEDAPLQLLVSKFNESLSLAESFPIIMSDATGDITAGIKLLAQPLKIRLVRDAGESGIADYGNNVVLIEPLATIKAVHDFLWPKVSQGSEEAEHSSPAMGAAGFDDRSEERRLLDHEDEIDEDEDEDEPPADITRPTPARPNQQGGEVAANGDKVQALSFFTNGRQVAFKCPIIQAVGGSSPDSASPYNIRQVWDQVHTITYRSLHPEEATASTSPSVADAQAKLHFASSTVLLSSEDAVYSMLVEECDFVDASMSADTKLMLRTLRALSILNNQWELLSDGQPMYPRRPMIKTSEFVNVKLSWKLMRQLQDPLMLCTSSLPSWCSDLAESCGFLFPLECREFFTSCTAFGISRALHSLQQRVQGSSSSDRPSEVRISRIQREKIRVSRARVLPSAMRALELYASHRSILEVEYFGEAGTGLGPTLEFFTLVAQALQNSKLGLWRDSSSTREREGEEPLPSPDDGLGEAPAQAETIRGFHEICILRCSTCTTVSFPRCERHSTLLTKHREDGAASCHKCDETRVWGGGACQHCKGSDSLAMEWWMLSDEEATYLHSAFPSHQQAIDHILLQCPECRSVNFPGTEQNLVVNRGGKMTSQSGRVMHEVDYRAVTRHVSNSCSHLPLLKVPVRLEAEECEAVARLVSKTPEAEEGVDEVSQAQQVHTYVVAPYGLFPAPLQPANESATLPCFLFLGRLMGKALLDQRNLDLPLSPAFFKKMVGQELTFQDLALIDPKLYQTLMKMKEAIKQRETNPSSEMTIDACRIEDLCLDMTCPGYPDVLLHPEGNNVSVTDANLHEYVEAVVQKVMGEGVEKQFEQFKKGFDEVFPMRHLRVFSPEELELHVRGDQERWDAETLRASIQPDHGYSEASLPVLWLINVMSTMDKSERRLLMRFLTGSPTLPAGGLRRLTPRLTVVRKEAEAPLTADDYLPSVMTCANYLKLPEYSSEEVLRKQLFTAMREGQLCFLLS
uniref:HECT-type E3 ubiquitin transferase n=1 Tax=Guillardia theta TaxID=55529 RepID=A0A7S4P489_GUITH|mmetsp:Transcript_42812/g.134919  ORF Transcript_42812/g.134919 Transcript_42812/m.134919 type:complete len:1585 (+) Transcript_42812:66-4820(+)